MIVKGGFVHVAFALIKRITIVSATERCLSSKAASSSEWRIINGTNGTENEACQEIVLQQYGVLFTYLNFSNFLFAHL